MAVRLSLSTLFVFMIFFHLVSPSNLAFDFAGLGTVTGVHDVLSRTLGSEQAASVFDLHLVKKCTAPRPTSSKSDLCFELSDGPDGKIIVKGTSGVELAYGAGWYLRTRCHMSFSWNRTGGNHILIPKTWPKIGTTITKYRTVPISYFSNVVTFSYSYVWYNMDDWTQWIDWAALSGINLALSYTGQEEIYRKTFNQFGINDTVFAEWSNGAAWLAWSRGQSMHGCGLHCGGACQALPLSWMKKQWQLQKDILALQRSIGIVGVLPTFQGNVPPLMRELYPNANITKKGAAWFDDLDPLFTTIQKAYMKILIADFGTDHWYETDGFFNQHQGPWYDKLDESRTIYQSFTQWTSPDDVPIDPLAYAHSATAYMSMNSTDPKAIWFYQGWIWRGWPKDKLPFMKGFISAPPPGTFVMLDMFDEVSSLWDKFDNFGYFGAPYIWSVLHNFGGNTGMWGSIPTLNSLPFDSFKLTTSVSGTGAAPEGIDQNPIYYQFLTDLNWMSAPVSLTQWVNDWTISRYGRDSDPAKKAWQIMLNTVYANDTNHAAIKQRGGFIAEKNADALTGLPFGGGMATPHDDWYSLSQLLPAWKLLLQSAQEQSLTNTMRYDLVNLGREILSKLSNRMFTALTKATTVASVTQHGNDLYDIMSDTDRLLCTDNGFVAGTWIKAAKSWGSGNEKLEQYYEMNARSQTTTWGPQSEGSTSLHTANRDYANKQWGGQVGSFYLGRERCYINQAKKDFAAGKKVNQSAYFACAASWSFDWTNDFSGKYPICWERTGDAIAISEELYSKYHKLV